MVSSPAKKDEDYNSKWGSLGKTAKMMARQWCSDNGFYDYKMNDNNWNFWADCSGDIPNDWSRPMIDERARELGFTDRNDFAKNDCKKKGFQGINSFQYRDKGEWAFSLQCINNEWNDKQTNVKDSKGSTISFQRCDQWIDNDPNSCKDKPPEGTTGWMRCAIGSDPTTTSCSGYSEDFNCWSGQACFAIQGLEPNWDAPVSGCDGVGSKLTIQKCNNWPNNDPSFCKKSKNKPNNIVKWINCGIGSSPGGIAPGDKATACSPLSKGQDDFPCIWGQNCFAVTNQVSDSSCKNSLLSNPVGAILDNFPIIGFILNFFGNITYVAIICFILCCLSSSSSLMMMFPGSGS